MSTILIYVLLATSGAHGTIVLSHSKEPNRCEAIKAQIEAAPSTGMSYRCETLVAPKGVL